MLSISGMCDLWVGQISGRRERIMAGEGGEALKIKNYNLAIVAALILGGS